VIAGGTAYAANTVFSADIVDGEVKSVDIANNAVRSTKIGTGQVLNQDLGADAVDGAKIFDASLSAADLGFNSVASGEIATDGVKATEIADNSIDSGEIVDDSIHAADLAAGAVGNNVFLVSATSGSNTNAGKSVSAVCPSGVVLGGGYAIGGIGSFDVVVHRNEPFDGAWVVGAHQPSGTPTWTLNARAICAR
jgi:hypothetical protein